MYNSIPSDLFGDLPYALAILCEAFDEKHPHERDMFLTGALPVLGGVFANCAIAHRDGLTALNLNTLSIGAPGSGKGVLKYARLLGSILDARLRAKVIADLVEAGDHDEDYDDVDAEIEDNGDEKAESKRMLFVPGNSSLAALLDIIRINPHGVIFESEIKSILSALKSGISDFRYVLLQAFHQEPISLARRGRRVYIPRPAIGLAATGTPDDIPHLVSTIRDGLFSRLAIYRFDAEIDWQTHRPGEYTTSRDALINEAAVLLDEVHSSLMGREYRRLVVTIDDADWDYLDKQFREEHEAVKQIGETELGGIVRRAAVIAARIAALLTLLRACEDSRSLAGIDRIVADPRDVVVGVGLARTYLSHSRTIASELPDSSMSRMDMRIMNFLALLPDQFTTAQALKVGASMGAKERTVKGWLVELLKKGRIEKVETGCYARSPTS